MGRRPLPNAEPSGSPSTQTAVKAVAYIIQGKRGGGFIILDVVHFSEGHRGSAALTACWRRSGSQVRPPQRDCRSVEP